MLGWHNLYALLVKIGLSNSDLLCSGFLSSHLIQDESYNKSNDDENNESSSSNNDEDGSVISTLDDGDLSVRDFNDSSSFPLVELGYDFSSVDGLTILDGIVIIDLHDWNVGNKDTTNYFWFRYGGC